MIDMFLICFFANVLSMFSIFALFTIVVYFYRKKISKVKNIK